MSSLGGSPRKLIPLPFETLRPWSGAPQWSPDGTEVAVALKDAKGNYVEIVAVESLETHRLEFRTSEGEVVYDLRWSPDGRTFGYIEGAAGNTEVTRLWVVSSSGGTPEPVTGGGSNPTLTIAALSHRLADNLTRRLNTSDLAKQTAISSISRVSSGNVVVI